MAELTDKIMVRANIGMVGNGDPLPRFDHGRFCRRFLLLGTLSFIIASLLPDWCLEPVSRFTARGAALLLELCGVSVIIDKATLIAGSFTAVIIPECTPLFMAALFCSFALAAPVPTLRKLPGLIAGIAALTALNIIRIALSVSVGSSHPILFSYVHSYLGQAMMLCSTWAVCMVWLRTVLPGQFPERVPAFLVRFAAFSSLLFIVWLPLSKWYIRGGDAVVSTLLSLFGLSLEVGYHRNVYFQTFSLTSFSALILATRTLSPWKKAKGILVGLSVLFCTHILFRSCGIVFALPGLRAADGMRHIPLTVINPASLNKLAIFLNVAGELLIPIILWLAIASREKRGESAPRRQADHVTTPHPTANWHPPRPSLPWWR